MGIRVHKAVGYGIRKFKAPEGFDARIEQLMELTPRQFANWMRKNERLPTLCPQYAIDMDLDGILDRKFPPYIPWLVMHDTEMGIKDALLISPAAILKDCHRYDSLIDWLEERPHCRSRWKWLKNGIFPYDFGKPPPSAIAVCLYLGIEHIIPNLREALYVKWS